MQTALRNVTKPAVDLSHTIDSIIQKRMNNNYPQFKDTTGYFDDKLFQFETESKGYIQLSIEFSDGKEYAIWFYEITRFHQDVRDEMQSATYFFEENVVILKEITPSCIIAFAKEAEEKQLYLRFIPLEI